MTVIAPRDRQEMSARKRDVTRAEEEGVDIRFMTRPRRIVPESTGRVHVLCQSIKTDSEKDVQKRYPPLPNQTLPPASMQTWSLWPISANLIWLALPRRVRILAIGFKFTPSATLAVHSLTLLAARPNIFAAGDMLRAGPR